MSLWEEAIALSTLRAALDQAARNRAGPGADGVTVAAFAADADANLRALRDELLRGEYRPRPARTMLFAKPGGGHRRLAVSNVRDRVVQHALAATLSASLDGALHPQAWAWRRGRSPRDALAVVDAAMAAGLEWVFRGDVESFFDRIPQGELVTALRELTADEALCALVERVLAAGALVGRQIADPALGTGQGSALSPFLANVYLLPFDRAMEAAGFTCVRYGDDLCVPAATRADAERARETAARALERLRLALNAHKVEVRHRGESFGFLGFTFHAQGRRPSDRARRALAESVESLLRERPSDHRDELDDLLSGWVTYYGSLAGVELPEAVRREAEGRLEQRAQRVESAAAVPPRQPAAPWDDAPDATRWQTAALRLAAAQGTPDEPTVRDGLRASLAVPAGVWPELAAALVRFDGRALAEQLAALGRFGDASEAERIERPAHLTPTPDRPRGPAVVIEDAREAPRFQPEAGDAERLLEVFGGAEHVWLRDVKVADKVERQRVTQPLGVDQARAHLAGTFWLGVYPLRANHAVRFAAVRVVDAARGRAERGRAGSSTAAHDDAARLDAAVEALGLRACHSVEPGRARVVWVLFARPIAAARARALLALVLQRAGVAPAGVSRELLPAQDTAKPDKPGTGVLLPLGRDPRTGERAWFCDNAGEPVADACAWLRALEANDPDRVADVLGVAKRLPPLAPKSPVGGAPPPPPAVPAKPIAPDAVALATSPLRECPRGQEVYTGCAVLRHFVDQAVAGAGLATGERMWVADVLGRLGDESTAAVESVFRHLDDFKPGMAARHLARLYPSPTSCARVRQRWPELTARVGCDCRFRVPPGAYPTPVLHALGAAEVPALASRVKDAAARGGLARAAVASMNEGRRELGAKAAALCARLADLRRQRRVVDRAIEAAEAELDAVVDEAGDEALETPNGTLRRVTEGGARRFVLEV